MTERYQSSQKKIKKMKIHFLIKSLSTSGGMERMTSIIANQLSMRGYETAIICLANEGKPFFELLPTVKVIYLHHEKDKRMSLMRDVSRRKKLKQIYREDTPDVIVFVGSGSSMLNIPSAKGFKTVTWEHFNANVNWHLMHPISKWMAAKYCDKVVTLTERDVINYKRKFGAKNATCIPNPTTINITQHSELSQKRVLAIGRLMPQKGFDLLLEAWSRVENRKNGWQLRIVGSGKMEKALKEIIKHHQLQDSVEIVPPSNNIIAQYLDASIFALSSRYEGLPLVMIEAMSAGLPIVSFDCETGPADIIIHNENGILVPKEDTDTFARELDSLINDENKRKQFAENGINRSHLFSVEMIMPKWEALFSELSNKKSK